MQQEYGLIAEHISFIYEASKPGMQDNIVDMAFNCASVHDTAKTGFVE